MKLTVKNPCEMDWNAMSGCETRRFCGSCDKHVHDLSEMTEDEALELVSRPGVCARFKTDRAGNVVFKRPSAGAAAMVMAAVFAAAPAMAGSTAADGHSSWGEWLIELVSGETDVQTLGEVAPDEEFLMGDVAMVLPPVEMTVHNQTPVSLDLRCPDVPGAVVPPGGTTTLLAHGELACQAIFGAEETTLQWTSSDIRCERTLDGLICRSDG